MNNLNNIHKLNKINYHPPQPSTKPSESMVKVIYNKLVENVSKILKSNQSE